MCLPYVAVIASATLLLNSFLSIFPILVMGSSERSSNLSGSLKTAICLCSLCILLVLEMSETLFYNLPHQGRQHVRPDTRNWIAMAEYDLETARHMLAAGRYPYVVFMCHLSLEKMLKAHVTEATQSVPAKSHDLIYLLKKSGLALSSDHIDFIGKINNASIPTRYPDDLQRMIGQYPEQIARDYLTQTEEVLEWLKRHPILQK
ncbi:MAG: hypothetical protein CVU64_08840 [Deltaproteobacteria bacterium HGW-Deltaproteobacteria-21]|nr:MAG: hypothetical protein CVU64_08840 [Deltaproteobacteria bacterium HGW-Deltaproteobacteria-21]